MAITNLIIFNPFFIFILYSIIFRIIEESSNYYKKDFFITFFTFFQILEVIKCGFIYFVQ